jgi:hypothetical protein
LPLLLALLLTALLLLAACGDDDDDDSGDDESPTASAEATDGENGEDPSGSPGGNGETPAGTAGVALPEECDQGEGQTGLLSDLILSGDDGVFPPGEEITMTLRLVNCSETATTLSYPTTQRYLFTVVEEEDESEVWNSAAGQEFPATPGEEAIAAGETVEYTEVWGQTNNEGAQVPAGRYKVKAFSVGCGGEAQTDCMFGPISLIEISE